MQFYLISVFVPILCFANANERQKNYIIELGQCVPHSGSEESNAQIEAEKANLSDQEILARLILSESLSTGFWKNRCKAHSSVEIMESIGWGVMNRVKAYAGKGNPFREIIFQKNQFRTSFSGKKKNPFAISFLCPLRAQEYLNEASSNDSAELLHRQAFESAQKIINESIKDIPKKFRNITNFFYPKSEFFGEIRPSWALNSEPEKNKGYLRVLNVQNPCVEFYHLK